MTSWTSVLAICIVNLVFGAYIGRRGTNRSYVAVVMLAILTTVFLTYWFRNLSLSATALRAVLLFVAFVVGSVFGTSRRDGGSVPTSVDARDEADLEMYRRAGATPQALEYERIYRQARRGIETAPARDYMDADAGFSLRIPSTWNLLKPAPDFQPPGQRLAIMHSSQNATLTVTVRDIASEVTNEVQRQIELENDFRGRGYSRVTTDVAPVSGERNAVTLQARKSDGAWVGIVSVMHHKREYSAFWIAAEGYETVASDVARSIQLV